MSAISSKKVGYHTGRGPLGRRPAFSKTRFLGRDNREILCRTLVWVLGIQFALRVGQEHRDLRLKNSQLCLEHVQKLSCVLQPFFFVGFNPRNDRLKKKLFERHTEIVASAEKGVVIRSP